MLILLILSLILLTAVLYAQYAEAALCAGRPGI